MTVLVKSKIHSIRKILDDIEEIYEHQDYDRAIYLLRTLKLNIEPLINSIELEKNETNMPDMQK